MQRSQHRGKLKNKYVADIVADILPCVAQAPGIASDGFENSRDIVVDGREAVLERGVQDDAESVGEIL